MAFQNAVGCASYQEWSRRSLLRTASASLASVVFGPSALAQIAVSQNRKSENALVVVFLRGGADGLNILAPYREDAYFKLRPSLALTAPRQGSAGERAIDLDGTFAFHPALRPLESHFKEGRLACVHAVGSNDGTRSHFEAMAAMERGLPYLGPGASRTNGWLARYLNATREAGQSPLRAVAISEVMPDTMRGAENATNIRAISDFQISGTPEYRKAIEHAYQAGTDPMATSGRDTLSVLGELDRLDYRSYKPVDGLAYPSSDLGQGLKQVAFLIKAGIGLEVAFLDKDGWDTHVAQGAATGWQASLIGDLANSLAAFADDLGGHLATTSIVVMTEFGRRAYENSGLGTDHGRASVMFALGGGVRGGRVYGKWPGLDDAELVGPGDLKVTTDYRDVLAEVLRKRHALSSPDRVFSDLRPKELGIWG